jgi:hypothetical protein
VIADVIVVIDEGPYLPFKIARQSTDHDRSPISVAICIG